MKIYLVGGAVRDQSLGREVTERDYVVVGATPEEMLARGFQAVGKDFPVFLHPQTKEEYALARTERKTGKGYTGFATVSDPSITLEQDLLRRDLTINAMAEDDDGNIIDPFHGQADLQQKVLRHVSPAFSEDPVRILRLARFAARFPEFTVHPETNQLMIQMVQQGEVDALVEERVWKEFSRALTEEAPKRFFEVLENCQALEILMPEIALNKSRDDHLFLISNISNKATIRFAALAINMSLAETTALCQKLRAPNEFTELAKIVSANSEQYYQLELIPTKIVEFFEQLDAYRRPDRFLDFSIVAGIRFSDHQQAKKKNDILMHALEQTQKIDTKPFIAQGLQGKAIADAIHAERIAMLMKVVF